jgi:hypothetical protein
MHSETVILFCQHHGPIVTVSQPDVVEPKPRALFWCSIVGGSQLLAAAPKYAKSPPLLGIGHAEHELSFGATMSAADDVRL